MRSKSGRPLLRRLFDAVWHTIDLPSTTSPLRGRSRREIHRHFTRRSRLVATGEQLEPRMVLSGQPLGGIFAQLEDHFGVSGSLYSAEFSLRPQDFRLAGETTVLSFQAMEADGSGLDPDAVQLRDDAGNLLLPTLSLDDVAGGRDSVSLFELVPGDYTVEFRAFFDDLSSGAFRLSVGLVGDLVSDVDFTTNQFIQGADGRVDERDSLFVQELLGSNNYVVQADVNLDGQIDLFDSEQLLRNLGDRTRIHAGVVNDDLAQTNEKAILRVPATDGLGRITGLLENDFDPFHPTADLEVTSYDSTTLLGHKVSVNSDGSFSYSPNSGETAWNLHHGQQVYDSFQYTVNGKWSGTATIIVDGRAEAPDDVVVSGPPLYDQNVFIVVDAQTPVDEDTSIVVAAPGLLHNDPAGRVVANAELQYSSTLGANVTVAADGAFEYDPTFAERLQSLAEGERVVDVFTYFSGTTPGTDGESVTVSVELIGRNDLPEARNDEYEIDQVTLLDGANLLDNDVDRDLSDTLFVSDFQQVSTAGAMVVVHADGTFTYDPTKPAALAALSRGQVLVDTFTYEISDGLATAVGTASITVTGANHPIIANVDVYRSDEDSVLSVPAESGVLSNDRDADTTDTLAVIAFDPISSLGAGGRPGKRCIHVRPHGGICW